MSVYTQLSLQQVQTFAADYALQIVDLQPIQGGIENTNYFLTAANKQQYVLTVFEELDSDAAAELIPALQHLGNAQVPVAVPLLHHQQAIHPIAHKPAQIAPRLAGQHPIPSNLAQVQQMGHYLAKLHLALQHFPLQRESNHGQNWWQSAAKSVYATLGTADQALMDQVFALFSQRQNQYPDRPRGLIHGDLFRDNTLYVGDQLTAILDFSELSNDEFLLDISICLNDFCSAYPSLQLDKHKMHAFINSYHQIRPLTADEQACLPAYLAMAACRFWISRLQVAQRNQLEGRSGTDILQKDPNEMRLMLIDRLQQEY